MLLNRIFCAFLDKNFNQVDNIDLIFLAFMQTVLVSHSRCILKETRVEIKWLEQLWNHKKMFETEEVRANEC